jgi:hypothetical protein
VISTVQSSSNPHIVTKATHPRNSGLPFLTLVLD